MSAAPSTVYPVLPRSWRLGLLAVVVLHFLVGHGAVWLHRFDWDRSIAWSYVTIPPLVAAALLWRRRLGWVAFLLHTLELAFAKFAVTAAILLGILIATRNDPAPPVALPWTPPKEVLPAPRQLRPVDPAQTGELAGRVVDASGDAVAGALVWVAAGLESWAFAAPTEPLLIAYDGSGLSPWLLGGQQRRPLAARSSNGQLHTLLLESADSSVRRNIPLLASGAVGALASDDLQGLFSIRCSVHGAKEGRGFVVLAPTPWVGLSAADGTFRFAGVPRVEVTVAAFHPHAGATPHEQRAAVGAAQQLVLRLAE